MLNKTALRRINKAIKTASKRTKAEEQRREGVKGCKVKLSFVRG